MKKYAHKVQKITRIFQMKIYNKCHKEGAYEREFYSDKRRAVFPE